MSQAPLVLVDGSSYLYRAFHALPPLMTSTGLPTGAVKGVLNMLRSLQKQYPESVITVIFDAKGPTFRDELFAEYKAQRPRMPDDLRVQIEPLHECVKAMGFPFLCVEGVEADDVIGTLARSSTLAERDVVISTGDKDMAQLVNGHVSLVNTMYNTKTDSAGVVEKFGIGPELIIDYLALMGDKSDNIPGVPGVGEKTALGLLVGLGDMDAIYDNIDKVATLPIRGAKTLGAKLLEHRDMAYLSRKLATIKTDVELELDIDQMHMQDSQDEILMELYQRLEFKSWQDEIRRRSAAAASSPKPNAKAASPTADDLFSESATNAEQLPADSEVINAEPEYKAKFHTILTDEAFADWLARLSSAELFAFDTETTSVDAQQARLVGISFAVAEGEAAYVPLAHSYMGVP
ncbi:MAG: 5'-3' exonuclease H3TH domain-containing protein, partial [Pseudomonas sp.]|nr:5'-3' exonuclease H3TH domain-containing protein [Pseudomonas sp.]